jgi:hypothetical protein
MSTFFNPPKMEMTKPSPPVIVPGESQTKPKKKKKYRQMMTGDELQLGDGGKLGNA